MWYIRFQRGAIGFEEKEIPIPGIEFLNKVKHLLFPFLLVLEGTLLIMLAVGMQNVIIPFGRHNRRNSHAGLVKDNYLAIPFKQQPAKSMEYPEL